MRDWQWHNRKHLLPDWQVQLIEEVCKSEEIQSLGKGAELLRYLAVYSDDCDKKMRNSSEISDQVIGNGTNVRSLIAKLQHQLDRYFDDTGSQHEHRILINRSEPLGRRNPNQFAVEYISNRGYGPATRKFWKDYLSVRITTLIGFGIPLFQTDEERTVFTRNVNLNEDRALPNPELASYPFVTVGEVMAMLHLTKWLTSKHISVIHQSYEHESHISDPVQNFTTANGIILGAPQINGVLEEYQREKSFRFVLENRQILDLFTGETTYAERTVVSGHLDISRVLVSRRPGMRGGVITLISANKGRAIQRIAESLTTESELKAMFQREPFASWEQALPPSFQLLFGVEILDRGRCPGRFRLLNWHPDGRKSAAGTEDDEKDFAIR